MKNPNTLQLSVENRDSEAISKKFIVDFKGEIARQVSFAMKKIAPIIEEHELQGGMLQLLFGQAVAKGYNPHQKAYYNKYMIHAPTVLAHWFCQALLHEDTSLEGALFLSIREASKKVLLHHRKLSGRGLTDQRTLFTAFYPAVWRPKYKGKCRINSAHYYIFPEFSRKIQHSSIHTLLTWALKSTKISMHVTLRETYSFKGLELKQQQAQERHQLHILDAIALGYEDVISHKENDLSAFKPHLNRQSHMDYEDVRFCSYESFMHLEENKSPENISFIAGNILEQLKKDYLHHGLTLTKKELAFFLTMYLNRASQTISHHDASLLDFYKGDVGQSILKRYITQDQLQYITFHHKATATQKRRKKEWFETLVNKPLPARLHRNTLTLMMGYNEMYIALSEYAETLFLETERLYQQFGYTFDGYFSCFSHLLLDAGCNIKYVLQAHNRFTYHSNYLKRHPFGDKQTYYTLDLKFVHDFYILLHPLIVEMFFTLKNFGNVQKVKKVSNILLTSMLSYNLEQTHNLNNLSSTLTALTLMIKRGIIFQDEVLNSINKKSALNTVLALCKDRELQVDIKVIHTIKERLQVQNRHLQMASNMLVKEAYIDLCYRLCSSADYPLFHGTNPMKGSHAKEQHYNIDILAHNHPLSLLGPSLSSVCISFDSHYHHQQLNPSFMNLCISNEKQLMLWGLLCRATHIDSGKKVYILNNFQGSVNDHRIHAKDIKRTVLTLLKKFIVQNHIDAIFLKDQYFNTLNLGYGLPTINTTRNQYYLETPARLDFEVNGQGVVLHNQFYVIDANTSLKAIY